MMKMLDFISIKSSSKITSFYGQHNKKCASFLREGIKCTEIQLWKYFVGIIFHGFPHTKEDDHARWQQLFDSLPMTSFSIHDCKQFSSSWDAFEYFCIKTSQTSTTTTSSTSKILKTNEFFPLHFATDFSSSLCHECQSSFSFEFQDARKLIELNNFRNQRTLQYLPLHPHFFLLLLLNNF